MKNQLISKKSSTFSGSYPRWLINNFSPQGQFEQKLLSKTPSGWKIGSTKSIFSCFIMKNFTSQIPSKVNSLLFKISATTVLNELFRLAFYPCKLVNNNSILSLASPGFSRAYRAEIKHPVGHIHNAPPLQACNHRKTIESIFSWWIASHF